MGRHPFALLFVVVVATQGSPNQREQGGEGFADRTPLCNLRRVASTICTRGGWPPGVVLQGVGRPPPPPLACAPLLRLSPNRRPCAHSKGGDIDSPSHGLTACIPSVNNLLYGTAHGGRPTPNLSSSTFTHPTKRPTNLNQTSNKRRLCFMDAPMDASW